jgi:hypothetical protein
VTKKRGNPNWDKPDMNIAVHAAPSSFDEVVRKLHLAPTEYEGSIQLQNWARKNKDHKYVPSHLLEAWGLEVKADS